jgi:hypothetical protein
MGTNYYLKTAACECCGLHDERNTMHIGKSSGGWCFSLHVGKWLNDSDDEPEAHSLEDWQALWSREGWIIVNEYQDPITTEEMMDIITNRKREEAIDQGQWGTGWYSNYGSFADYLRENHAVEGPNNLLRHRIDGKRCVGHGEGTYDYITGEFS